MNSSYQGPSKDKVNALLLAAFGLLSGGLIALKYRRMARKVSEMASRALEAKDARFRELLEMWNANEKA